MKLTNRLSLFFLAALGFVLVGFSLMMYWLAHWHLQAEMHIRLEAAMSTMLASTEVHGNLVEWEPGGRQITMADDPGLDEVRWNVFDAEGRLVGWSKNLVGPDSSLLKHDDDWHRLVRTAPANRQPYDHELSEQESRGRPLDLPEGFSVGQISSAMELPPDRRIESSQFTLLAAISPRAMQSTLWHLALAMFAVSVVIWLTAAAWGRWLCRKALEPIARMATSARVLRARPNAISQLDVAPTKDELEDLGMAFNELLIDLHEALERQRRFTGDASHQLRTPLTALLTSVQVASRQTRTSDEYQHVLEVVRRRGQQLQQILDALLLLARVEADAPLPDAQEIDLNELCRAKVAAWSENPRASDVLFHPCSTGSPRVLGQAVLIEQILGNLLDNAAKYSEPGTSITLAVDATDDEAQLTIQDEGCGIPPEELAHICEPFYRAARAKWNGKPGVGLGLTVVQRLIKVLGGRLDVESDVPGGSRFVVTLPRVADSSRSEQTPTQVVTAAARELPCSTK